MSTSLRPTSLAPTLWCAMRHLCADPGATVQATVGDEPVQVQASALTDGKAWVGIRRSWRWPFEDADVVGDLTLLGASRRLQLIGWWAPSTLRTWQDDRELTVLEMDVAGISLWDGTRHVSTEDGTKIARLLR